MSRLCHSIRMRESQSLFEMKNIRDLLSRYDGCVMEMTNSSSFLFQLYRRFLRSFTKSCVVGWHIFPLTQTHPCRLLVCYDDLYDSYVADKKENFRISWPFQHRLVSRLAHKTSLRFTSLTLKCSKIILLESSSSERRRFYPHFLLLYLTTQKITMVKRDLLMMKRRRKKGFPRFSHSWG